MARRQPRKSRITQKNTRTNRSRSRSRRPSIPRRRLSDNSNESFESDVPQPTNNRNSSLKSVQSRSPKHSSNLSHNENSSSNNNNNENRGNRGKLNNNNGASGGGGGGGRPGDINDNSYDNICAICRSDITDLAITNCNHRFCRECIAHWTQGHSTCPTCRTTINTIRVNISEAGTFETVNISRAEILARKINETHSMLMLLFTVIAHSLLPEVSSTIRELDDVARDLNVPTTNSRAARAAEQASASDRSSSGTESAFEDSDSDRSSSSSHNLNLPSTRNSETNAGIGNVLPFARILTLRPIGQPTAYLQRRGAMTTDSSDDSDDESSIDSQAIMYDSSTNRRSGFRDTRASVAHGAPAVVSISNSPNSSNNTNATTNPVDVPTLGCKMVTTSPTTSTSTKSDATANPRTQPSANELINRPSPAPTSSTVNNGQIAWISSPPSTTQNQSRPVLSTIGTVKQIASKVTVKTPTLVRPVRESTPLPTRTSNINNSSGAHQPQFRMPQSAPPPVRSSQRPRDIRHLSESYRKINQVFEILQILHILVHRNSVDLEVDDPDQ